MDNAVSESALVQQLKLQPDVVRQGWMPPPTTMGERNR
jgi:hypothetical protein